MIHPEIDIARAAVIAAPKVATLYKEAQRLARFDEISADDIVSGLSGVANFIDRATAQHVIRSGINEVFPEMGGDPSLVPDTAPVVRSDHDKQAVILNFVCMADVKPIAIEPLWPGRLAIGKVHVIAGEGGKGKSTLLIDWTARTTRGTDWPDGAQSGCVGSVIILASEDDTDDTIAPRLIAADADMKKVYVVQSVEDKGRRRGFNLQADLAMLEQLIQKLGDVLLVIFDPISSYLGKVDSHNNADVRSVLDPLGEFAARMKVAVVCNNHFSKAGGSANSRVIGSVAFVNQARAAFIVTEDENDPTRKLLIPSKMNIGPMGSGLAYRIEGCQIEHDGEKILTSRIMYESAPVNVSADAALAALDNGGDNHTDKAEAIEFLTNILQGGPMPAKDVKREATEAGISGKSLRSAREALSIKPAKAGFGDGWVWALPKMPSGAEDALS
jgi:putative DNA primase/helicase